MFTKKRIALLSALLSTISLLFVLSTTTIPNVFASHGDTPQACYNDGWDAGQGDEFSQELYEVCQGIGGGDEYYDGFIDGCMDADNSREVCEQATDS